MTPPTLSDQAVQKATGESWEHGFGVLDAVGAQKMTHKAIAQHLIESEGISGWWAQSITVAYERARGMRAVGETTRGFQVSKQKTFLPDPTAAWELLLSTEGLTCWLGEGAPPELSEGQVFELNEGARVEVRGIRPGEQVRLGWEPAGGAATQVLIALVSASASGRGTIGFTWENLPDAQARDQTRERLGESLARLAALFKGMS